MCNLINTHTHTHYTLLFVLFYLVSLHGDLRGECTVQCRGEAHRYSARHYTVDPMLPSLLPRAFSLRNLVSGYECGRVFPAGVGPGSPSRDAANWLLSWRFGLPVETRRQYGWLRMVFSGVCLFRAPIWWPSGGWRHARAGSTVAESPVVLYQVGTHQIRRRQRAARSLTSQGRAEPLCARIESANREVSEGKADR